MPYVNLPVFILILPSKIWCKGTTKFADVQENSDFFRYFQFRGRSWGELQFRVSRKETAIYASLHKWQGAYNAILNMSGKGIVAD